MEKNTFGAILRKKRQQCGLSQYQLGMLLKVSDKAVSKWENDLARPKSQLLYQLSTILGITLDELFAGEKYTGNKERSCSVKEQHRCLWNKAYSNLMIRYADKHPMEMISRFEMEKLAFMNTDMILYFDLISKISENALKKGCPISAEGGIGASFVAYLLGASDVNPLPAHYYCLECKEVEFVPEAFDGWELEKKTVIVVIRLLCLMDIIYLLRFIVTWLVRMQVLILLSADASGTNSTSLHSRQ